MDSPFLKVLSFKKLIDGLQSTANGDDRLRSSFAKDILSKLEYRSELENGLEDISKIGKYKHDLDILMIELFPTQLGNNEIKILTPPFIEEVIYSSDRFKSIFKDKNELSFTNLRNYTHRFNYVLSCAIILMRHYGVSLNVFSSLFADLRDKNGIQRHFKALVNAEFTQIQPIDPPPKLTKEEINNLLANREDESLWRKHFPPKSWKIFGFTIINLVDVTRDQSLANYKNLLIERSKFEADKEQANHELKEILSSYFNIPDLDVSVNMFDSTKNQIINLDHDGDSISMKEAGKRSVKEFYCAYSSEQIFEKQNIFVIPSVEDHYEHADSMPILKRLKDKGYKNFMVAPLVSNNVVIGVLEFASKIDCAFNSLSEFLVQDLIPVTQASLKAFLEEIDNTTSAFIQKEFTAIHSSVEWKFNEIAESHISNRLRSIENEPLKLTDVIFKDLYALYGQIDIAGSSTARNKAIESDLSKQLTLILDILTLSISKLSMPILNSIYYQINMLLEQVNSDLASGIEQDVVQYIKSEVAPLLKQLSKKDANIKQVIDTYNQALSPTLGIIYKDRKDYDESVERINNCIAKSLDKKQQEAQKIYPHYFERYKTDGVDHNMYIGESITAEESFDLLYLKNLHLWQLKTICELELEQHVLKTTLPLPLNVASLIMVYSNPLSIRYQLDEKQFNVDGAYNARYEIIKKRIDKAYIKGTKERITKVGKVVIVYTQASDLEEYKSHINYLTYSGILHDDMELIDIEDLQGVTGLKAIRVGINFDYVTPDIEATLVTKVIQKVEK